MNGQDVELIRKIKALCEDYLKVVDRPDRRDLDHWKPSAAQIWIEKFLKDN